MAGRSENPFEVLSREEAEPMIPAGEVTEEVKKGVVDTSEKVKAVPAPSAAAQVDAPPTPGRGGPLPKAQVPVEPDVNKAPGNISYAEAAKAKAGEAAESAKEAAADVKERAAEAGVSAKQKAGELSESAKQAASDARQRAEELAGGARERATEYGDAAKEKAADVAQTVSDSVSSAVKALKEHLPEVHVEHEEPSREEQESQALLDEAMEMAGGAPAPIRTEAPSRPATRPAVPSSAPPATTSTTTRPTTTQTAAATGTADLSAELASPGGAYPPVIATEVANRAAERAAEVAEAARSKAAELVHAAPGSTATPEHSASAREAAKAAAPDELVARVERVERSAKGPLEALAGTLKGAADYLKEHVLRSGSPPGSPRQAKGTAPAPGVPEGVVAKRTGSGRVHEYSALPGDIHPAQLAQAARAVREKVLHAPAATEEKATEARDTAVGGMRAAGREMEGTASATAGKAESAYESAKEAVSSAADKAESAYERTKGEVSEKAEMAYERTKGAAGEAADKARGAADRVEERVKEASGREGAAASSWEEGGGLSAKEYVGEKYAGYKQGAAGTTGEAATTSPTTAPTTATGTGEGPLDRAGGALASARERVSSAVAAAEDKAKSAYERTKEELKQTTGPESPEDAVRTAGIIPSDTETLLKQRGGAAHEAHEVREDEERNKMRTEEMLEEAALAYGEENLAPPEVSDIHAEAEGGGPLAGPPRGSSTGGGASAGEGIKGALQRVSAEAKEVGRELKAELKEAVKEIDTDRPGDEGEIPS